MDKKAALKKAYLSLGSNIGDKKAYLDSAIESLDAHNKVQVVKVSSYYKTEPIGYTHQDWFLNVVIAVETDLNPHDLLDCSNTIERRLSRKRSIPWGPRTIDIDMLLYEDLIIDDVRLTLPHPRMLQRAFVIIPLQEIAPKLRINGQNLQAFAVQLADQKVVLCTSQLTAD